MATGVPDGAELALLESLGDLVAPELLTEPAFMPHTSNPARLNDRRNLRRAMKLLDDAGWSVGDDGKRRNAQGQPMRLTFLFNTASEGTLSAVIENFISNLTVMGIDAVLEKVDPAQYTLRERERDYDLIFDSYAPFLGAGTGLMQRYGSEDAAFSVFNPAGLASPLVDAVINKALLANSSEEEQTALRVLDRVLRYEFFMIPVWYNDSYWVSYYDQYAYPDPLPPYDLGFLDFWWFDEDKAAALKSSGALR
jgi:microcin C transport system substrate-binding protein